LSTRILRLIDLTAEKVSASIAAANGASQDSLLSIFESAEEVHTLAEAFSIAPGMWALYFLSKLRNVMVVTSFLEEKEFLDAMGLSWLYVENVKGDGKVTMISEADLGEQEAALNFTHDCLKSVLYAVAAVLYVEQQFQLKPPTSLADLLNTPIPQSDQLQNKSFLFVAALCEMSTPETLAANAYIPVIASMAAFVRDKLACRFTSSEEYHALLEDELDKLPLNDRWAGYGLLRAFLEAWQKLQQLFGEYVQCQNEVEAASKIPLLTDRHGALPVRISHLVEIAASDKKENESCPARI
jgi:hypothetical protein